MGAVHASIEETTLAAALQTGQAQPGTTTTVKTDIAPGSLPSGKIGKVSLGRLLIGGNLIGGWAHSRDLAYASKLFKSYNTEAKVMETLELALACGINTIQLDPACWDVISKFNETHTTKIQTMVCIPVLEDKTKQNDAVKQQIDRGADLIYSHGGVTDSFMMKGGSIDAIGQMIDLIKAQGVPAGVGGHSLNMPKACEAANIDNDFYVKTFHMDRYWSATPEEHREEYDWMRGNSDHDKNNDNMWCNNADETASFMETVQKPWVAFKVMAAGAISPRFAFPHAFRNGADFVIAGMFDFQVEEDVKLAIDSIKKSGNRTRSWIS